MELNRRSDMQLNPVMAIHRFAENGFTMIEIMMVVAAITIMALFVAPEVINFGPNMRVKAAARDLHTNLQKMKVEAINRDREAFITLNRVTCDAHPSTAVLSPGGTYNIDVDNDNNGSLSAGDIPLVMFDESEDAAPDYDYDMPENTALCDNSSTPAGTPVVFMFSPRGLWLDASGNPLGSRTDFRIQNDRERTYEVQVSIAGGISTVKCIDPSDSGDPCF